MAGKVIGVGTITVNVPKDWDDEQIVDWAQQKLGVDPNHPEIPVKNEEKGDSNGRRDG
jgi:hypothetical protein